MPNLPGVGLLVIFIFAASVFFAHARFCLRFTSALSGSIFLAMMWCLLSLGSWILFTVAAVGVVVLGVDLTEMRSIYDLPVLLFIIFMFCAVPYQLLLAVLGASVMKRDGSSPRAVLTIVLILVLSIPVMMIGVELSVLLWGIEIMT